MFQKDQAAYRNQAHARYLKDYTLLKLNPSSFQEIKSRRNSPLSIAIPYQSGQLRMELEPLYLFDASFKLLTDQSGSQGVPYQAGKYFKGRIKDDTTSLVTLSVFEDEVNGIISSARFGNLNLGRIRDQSPEDYIVYNESDAKESVEFTCASLGNAIYRSQLEQLQSQVDQQLESRADGCITVDFELTREVYSQYQNNINNAANWLTSLFAAVKSLYLNEQVNISIKTIFVWTSEDGYSDDVGTALDQLKARRLNDAAFTANFVHLVRGELCNGGCSLAGIAWLDVLCDNSYRFAVSEPLFSYAVYPSYSWSVNVLTHEQGHNIASPHTHWCGWTGGPIDGCADPDGTCAKGPTPPSGGGTIMSYCHHNVGINFANGFGPQPGTRIRARYNAANCLSTNCNDGITVPAGPSNCNDGIQNGSETGVDCGGSCAACLEVCANSVNLSQNKTTSQSTNFDGGNSFPASRAVDGSLTNFSHTGQQLQPWWQVDLGNTYTVSSIKITNRVGCAPCSGRLKRFKVFVSNTPPGAYTNSGEVHLYNNSSGLSDGQVYNIANLNASGRYVRIWADFTGYGNNYLHLAEVQVMGCDGVDPCEENEVPNQPTVSTVEVDFPRNGSFTVGAIASDPDGSIARVEFYNGVTLLGSDNSNPYHWTVSPATASSYSITAKAFDNCGESATSGILTVNTTISCSDGFQNGDEEGVDCGGSSCTDDCPQGCLSPVLLSSGKSTSQSSNFNGSNSYPASMVVDGSTSSASFNHTAAELQPWWQVDLATVSEVTSIEITHRTGCAPCAGRVKNFKVFVTNSPASSFGSSTGVVYEYNNSTGLGNGQVINISDLAGGGRCGRLWVNNASANYLHLAEVRVMGCATDPCSGNQSPSKPVLSSTSTSYTQNTSFSVNASSSDAGGIAEIRFYVGGVLHSTDNTSPYSMTINPASASSYSITAMAVDDCNAQSVLSDPLVITTTNSCSDGVRNGDETSIDCGGSNCTACAGCTSPTNVSQGKSASQSTNFNAANSYPASMAVDGSTASSSFNHTGAQTQPWWQVDLGSSHDVTSIQITHRTGCSACAGRIKKFRVFISGSPPSAFTNSGYVYEYNNGAGMANGEVLTIGGDAVTGRYVRIWADYGTSSGYIHFAEVRVFGCASTAPDILLASTESPVKRFTESRMGLENPVDFEVNIFPNPVRDQLNYNFAIPPQSPVFARIFDLQGRKVMEATLSGSRLDIGHLENGSYIIHIIYKDMRMVKKILKF
ncbi:MAG TPA: discoidin domain-containing protein [Saprospiraceae bacterium]|nr:discoidin domain-containing protein [Saprospiraceae bacterium]